MIVEEINFLDNSKLSGIFQKIDNLQIIPKHSDKNYHPTKNSLTKIIIKKTAWPKLLSNKKQSDQMMIWQKVFLLFTLRPCFRLSLSTLAVNNYDNFFPTHLQSKKIFNCNFFCIFGQCFASLKLSGLNMVIERERYFSDLSC